MKRIVVLAFAIIWFSGTEAQTRSGSVKKFGIRLGTNYSLMNFNKGVPRPTATVSNVWKPGVDIRALLNVKLTDRFFLQPEYALGILNGEDERFKTTYQLSYLSLPILLRIRPVERFSILLGPQFDLLIRADEKQNGIKTNITHDTEERNISAVFGLEYIITPGFYVDARFINGFNHVGIGQRSNVKEFKWQSFATGVGLRF